MLVRAFGVNASADLSVMNNFTDKGDISAFAVNAMASLIGGGHLYGGKDGKLMPKQLLTRAEGVVLLSRLMNASKNTSPEETKEDSKTDKKRISTKAILAAVVEAVVAAVEAVAEVAVVEAAAVEEILQHHLKILLKQLRQN